MQTLILWICLFFIVTVSIVTADRWNDEEYLNDDLTYNDESPRRALDVFTNVERRKWCGTWGDPCKPNGNKYQTCCPSLRCMCGLLWGRARCKCKGRTFGRR